MSAINLTLSLDSLRAATQPYSNSYDISENTEVFKFQDSVLQKQTIGDILKKDTTPVYFKPSIGSLEAAYVRNDYFQSPPDTHPVNLFATVTVNGEVVAEVFNKGTTKNYSIDIDLPDEPAFGKSLAQTRLDALLDATGGDVTYANLTQAERAAQIAAYEPPRYIHPSFVGIEEKYNAIQNGTSTLSDYEQESIRQLYEDERYKKYF